MREAQHRAALTDLIIEQGSVLGVGVYRTQQAVKYVTQNLRVRGARGQELQLHGADFRKQQHATPGPV